VKQCRGRNIKRLRRILFFALVYLFVVTVATLPTEGLPVVTAQHDKQSDVQTRTNIVSRVSNELQGYVVVRVEPTYPDSAKLARATGEVVVQVKINEEGIVISARATSGHPLLQGAAVEAARKWNFHPKPVKIVGTIIFNFELEVLERVYRPTGIEATINGTITLLGEAPAPKRVDMSGDPQCRRDNPDALTEDLIVTDRKIANVFVYAKGGSALDTYNFEIPSSEVMLYHKGCQYADRVLGIQTYQTLLVVNSDLTSHNTRPTPRINQEWNTSQGPGEGPIKKRFIKPETMIPFKCNQHPWERAYVGVLAHPFFAVTGKDGAFTIRGLPPGEYTLAAWHERLGEQTVQVRVEAGEVKRQDYSFNTH
jgi:TonB family protein